MDFITDIEKRLGEKVTIESITAGEYNLLLDKLPENQNTQETITLLQTVLKEHSDIKIIEITKNEIQETIEKIKIYNQTGINNTCRKENIILSALPNIKTQDEFDFTWKITESFDNDIEIIDIHLLKEYHYKMQIDTKGYEMVNYQDRLVFAANKHNFDLLNQNLSSINFYLNNVIIKNGEKSPIFNEFQIISLS